MQPWKVCISLLCAPALAAAVSWCVLDWEAADAETFPGGVVLRDAAGEILRVTLGADGTDCRPTYVANTNDWIVKAIVASEDNRFFSHAGVSPRSVVRAVLQNVTGGRRVSGASTISMQTVRLIRPHRKGYLEKWAEAVRAVKMERRRDKLCPPAISHRNTRCVDRAGKYFLEYAA